MPSREQMKREKLSKAENQIVTNKKQSSTGSMDRESKIMNTIVNTSIILMSTLMDGLAGAMMNLTGAMASGMAEAVGGEKAGKKVKKEFKEKQPEVNEKIRSMIADVRKDVYTQMGQKRKEIEPFLSDTAFDSGPKTVEEYDFKLPKLTEELDDDSLAKYARLLLTEDKDFAEMFEKLTAWMNSLPRFPEKTSKKND